MNEQQYAVAVTFPEPINGYWDGGKKGGGTFTPHLMEYYLDEPKGKHPGPGHTIRWGCFYLNYYITTGSGRTWREAASIAKRVLMRRCKIVGATFEIVPC